MILAVNRKTINAGNNKKNKKQRKGFEPSVPELELQNDSAKGEDRLCSDGRSG